MSGLMSSLPRPDRYNYDHAPVLPSASTRTECLEQILRAFFDIADRDDIHQAAERLILVQRWIRNEAERTAADSIFAGLQVV
jgi:hypothetical protein